MKILLPNLHQCKRMYKLLESFYNKNLYQKHITNFTEFEHAIIIFCSFYQIKRPNRIRFRRSIKEVSVPRNKICVGLCYESGNIALLYPYNFRLSGNANINVWIGVVYHELAHYYLWSKTEEKADEFESKMLRRR